MAPPKKAALPVSPKAKLAAVIKSARDAMRKDAGLNGDLDRIPQLAWLLFLKAFDGLERNREVVEHNFRPVIDAPYRWRDWAAEPNGPTGDALLKFVNSKLLPHLRRLSGAGSHDPRDVLASVFKETHNRMLSGYLLRDVVNKVDEINFASSDDIHTMAHLYESMLREMRDAAGDSGEFYTPRPIIRFIVQQVNPKLGAIILDPACGTGGFLVEALEHLTPQVKTSQQLRQLHNDLRGIEKKPLPYLLCMMNLVLHGVGQPTITRGNALAEPIMQIGKARRVDVVLTNPPFGGEEEKSIRVNFPADKQTAETAWLYLQLVIRQLKDGGRCGIVAPNGLLFGGGAGAKIKKDLLTDCNLHTIVRLPDGVFAPYTDIPTNLLFFDKTGRTKEVWFYEIPPPEGRKKYSKTKPMRFEEFADCQAWWTDRTENERAWRVPIVDIENTDYNLDLRNPSRPDDLSHRPPAQLLAELIDIEHEILAVLENLKAEIDAFVASASSRPDLDESAKVQAGWKRIALGEILTLNNREVFVEPGNSYKIAGVYSFGRGLFHRATIDGSQTSYRVLSQLQANQLVMSRLKAWEGALALVPQRLEGWCVSPEFPTFDIESDIVEPAFLGALLASEQFWSRLKGASKGIGARRERVGAARLLQQEIDLPPLPEQQAVARMIERVQTAQSRRHEGDGRIDALVSAALNEAFTSLS